MGIDTCANLESSVIGSILLDPGKMIDVVKEVKAEDFSSIQGRAAFAAIVAEWREKKHFSIIDVSVLHPELAIYLSEAMSKAVPLGVKSHAAEISKRAKAKRIQDGMKNILSSMTSPDDMLSAMMSLYREEISVGRKDPSIKSVINRVSRYMSTVKDGKIGFDVGFGFLREVYCRYIPGHIWLVGGFTSVGKTAVMIQKVCNLIVCGEGARIVIISTEMTEEQLVARILANFTGVPSMRILSGNYHSTAEEKSVFDAKNALKHSELAIHDAIYTIDDIEVALRKAALQGGVDVVFIDYVQNCRWPGAKSRYQEQSEIANRFQALAKEVKATLVCLSQVSNDVGRGNTEQLELKGAGEWAAVADYGIMLSRHKTERHRLKYMLKKNRHGALTERELEFQNVFTRLGEV